MAYSWLLLHYKVPREPSANRVYIWRKLKRMGALLLHDSIWVLPDNPRTLEQFQWLAAEISDMEGESILWESRLAPGGMREESLLAQFQSQVDLNYSEILAALKETTSGKEEAARVADVDLPTLSRRYQQAQQTDFFHSPLGQQLREALEAAREGITETEPKEGEAGK